MSQTILILTLIFGIGGPAALFIVSGAAIPTAIMILAGAFWGLSKWRKWGWSASIGLLLSSAGAAYGTLTGHSFELLAAAMLLNLAAWNLNQFTQRLDLAAQDDDVNSLERKHLGNVAAFVIISAIAIFSAQITQLQISFGQSIILVIAAIGGLVVMMRRIQAAR